MKQSSMDAMTTPDNNTLEPESLLERLRADYPDFVFIESNRFAWHSGKRQVSYPKGPLLDDQGTWAILHELGHALLDHADYDSDVELLLIEVSAWEKARELAGLYQITIEEPYIETCLDSYRDWLHVRSTCPTCYVRSLQFDRHTYRCSNCGTDWRVTRSRLCRPYRRSVDIPLSQRSR